MPGPFPPPHPHSAKTTTALSACAAPRAMGFMLTTYPQNLQLFEPLLHQLLYPPRIRLCAVLPKRISRSPLGVFSEVVGGELAGCAEEGAVEGARFDAC